MSKILSIEDHKLKKWLEREAQREKESIKFGNVVIKQYQEIIDVDPRIIQEMKEKLKNQPKEFRKPKRYIIDVDDSLIPIYED